MLAPPIGFLTISSPALAWFPLVWPGFGLPQGGFPANARGRPRLSSGNCGVPGAPGTPGGLGEGLTPSTRSAPGARRPEPTLNLKLIPLGG